MDHHQSNLHELVHMQINLTWYLKMDNRIRTLLQTYLLCVYIIFFQLIEILLIPILLKFII